MNKKEKDFFERILDILKKLLFLIGIVVAFYKLPAIIAEKISYWKIKNKIIRQNFDEED